MFVGRFWFVAVGIVLLVCGAPLDAAEPAEGKPGASASPAEAACPDEVTPPATTENARSHRRQADDKSPRSEQPALPRYVLVPKDPSVHPIERLRGRVAGSDVLHQQYPFVHQPTLAEAMRRLVGCCDACPLCGQPHSGDERAADAGATWKAPNGERAILGYGRLAKQAGDESSPGTLRAGEPAQVILDTQKRLGKSVLEGTEFGGSPELLIQWIRALDEENLRRQAAQPAAPRYESIEVALEEELPVTAHSQIVALREACRQLQAAADLLEEQNLFEPADALRAAADGLRRQSREKVGETEQAGDDAPGDGVAVPRALEAQ